ncbi:MAG: CvpA family protein [Dehalococcoidia bacterium]
MMNIIDWITITGILFFIIWGYKTGIINAVFYTLAIYVAIFLSGLFAGRVLNIVWSSLDTDINNKSFSTIIGYIIIFIIVMLLGKLTISLIKKTFTFSTIRILDKFGGILLGIAAGIMICGAVITISARYVYIPSSMEISSEKSLGKNIEDITESLSNEFFEMGHKDFIDQKLINSKFVPYIITLRKFVIEFAPEEFGLGLDILSSRIK